MLITAAAKSKARVRGRSRAGIAFSNPAGFMDVLSSVNVLLSGRGLYDGPMPRPADSSSVWYH